MKVKIRFLGISILVIVFSLFAYDYGSSQYTDPIERSIEPTEKYTDPIERMTLPDIIPYFTLAIDVMNKQCKINVLVKSSGTGGPIPASAYSGDVNVDVKVDGSSIGKNSLTIVDPSGILQGDPPQRVYRIWPSPSSPYLVALGSTHNIEVKVDPVQYETYKSNNTMSSSVTCDISEIRIETPKFKKPDLQRVPIDPYGKPINPNTDPVNPQIDPGLRDGKDVQPQTQ